MYKSLVTLSALALGLSACSVRTTDSSVNSKAKQSYQFSENGCDTDKHVFTSDSAADALNQMCAALKSEATNNGCAQDQRRQYFQIACTNQTWSLNSKAGDQTWNTKESYEFRENGCDTGKHEFVSSDPDVTRSQLCAALKDENLNNSCAVDSRRQYFTAACPGQFWN